jgi:copper homeostasis protein
MPVKPYRLEVCITSVEEALRAEALSADRVELCMRLDVDGMTPPFDLVEAVLDSICIPVRVMIRHTETGFEANSRAQDVMMRSVLELKTLPINGFVFGILKGRHIDREAMLTLLGVAHPLPVTFHKAIDLCKDIESEIAWLNEQGQIDTILTSGGAVQAIDGAVQIRAMRKEFSRQIMAGGKIMRDDLPMVHAALGLGWYHGRKIL